MNIHEHGGDPAQALREALDWLTNVSRRELPSADRVQRVYEAFLADLPDLAAVLESDSDRIPYVDFERIVGRWLIEAPAAIGAALNTSRSLSDDVGFVSSRVPVG